MRITLIILQIFVSINLIGQTVDDCSTYKNKLLIVSQVEGKTKDELRNEIFARHGYVFSNTKFQQYFESKNWDVASSNNSIVLSDIETKNVESIF